MYSDSIPGNQRPEHFGASAKTIQWNLLTEQHVSQLGDSLSLHADSEGHLLAWCARVWESILEEHRFPFLLMKVADMRMGLGSETTALALYEEFHATETSSDERFDRWIADVRSSVSQKTTELLILYKTDPLGHFSPCHRWVPTASDPFPSCSVNPDRLAELIKIWKTVEDDNTDWHGRFKNMICLETNYLEGIFQFDTNVCVVPYSQADSSLLMVRKPDLHQEYDILATAGFFDSSALNKVKRRPISGAVRTLPDVFSILQDTHAALDEIYAFLGPEPPELTVEHICRIHKKLMKTSQVIYNESGPTGRLCYVNIGITRQASCSNVMVWSNSSRPSAGGKPYAIQFCPYDEVDGELAIFCKRFNEMIQIDEIGSYACAAWINHVFVTIHPFEDGNGRLSRILSSIPLVRKGLPPLNVPHMTRDTYFMHLNNTRATPRAGTYDKLAGFLLSSTLSSLRIVDCLYHIQGRRVAE